MTALFDSGTRVRVEMTKWGERPHWSYDATYLGSDEHGDWLGLPAGTAYSRPGRRFAIPYDHVGLVPAEVGGERPWHMAVFYTDGGPVWAALGGSPVAVYVDMTTPPVWDGTTVRAVDLDLDVVRGFNGTVIVDDEDEFADHQVRFGYPVDVIEGARTSCDAVLTEVRTGAAPYDGSHVAWLDALRALPAR
ncbi:MAG TPA: DUF402 domain-containing protein [Nocardioides sp.]|jgi:hypothetical protein